MNKQEMVAQVAGKVGQTKKEVQNVVDAFMEAIGNTLARGERVTLVGFGTFQTMERKARRGVNPQTGSSIQIPRRQVPKFVPGKALKEKVR